MRKNFILSCMAYPFKELFLLSILNSCLSFFLSFFLYCFMRESQHKICSLYCLGDSHGLHFIKALQSSNFSLSFWTDGSKSSAVQSRYRNHTPNENLIRWAHKCIFNLLKSGFKWQQSTFAYDILFARPLNFSTWFTKKEYYGNQTRLDNELNGIFGKQDRDISVCVQKTSNYF
jgi:hypothetical protein